MIFRSDGVRCHSLLTSQCAGISLSHSTPESFMGTFENGGAKIDHSAAV